MKKLTKQIICTAFISVLCLHISVAQDKSSNDWSTVEPQIQQAIQAGDLIAAEAQCSSFISANPKQLPAYVKRGHIRAWQQKFNAAQQDFAFALVFDGTQREALLGSGYAFAWANEFDKARARFNQMLNSNVEDGDALKGLSWISVWEKTPEKGLSSARKFGEQNTQDDESYLILGRLYLLDGDKKAALHAFDQGLALNPSNAEIKQELTQMRLTSGANRPQMYVDFQAGRTQFQDTNDLGLRLVQAGFILNSGLNFWIKYDNSLSLDNRELVIDNRQLPSVFVGGYKSYAGGRITRLEIGRRDGSLLLQSEHARIFGNAITKFGLGLDKNDQLGNVWVGHAGLKYQFTPKFSLEPILFGINSDTQSSMTIRSLIVAGFKPNNKINLELGLAAGPDDQPTEAFLKSNITVWQSFGIVLMARREWTSTNIQNTFLTTGLSVQF